MFSSVDEYVKNYALRIPLTGKLNSSPFPRRCKIPTSMYKSMKAPVETETRGKEDTKTTSKFESLAGTKALPR